MRVAALLLLAIMIGSTATAVSASTAANAVATIRLYPDGSLGVHAVMPGYLINESEIDFYISLENTSIKIVVKDDKLVDIRADFAKPSGYMVMVNGYTKYWGNITLVSVDPQLYTVYIHMEVAYTNTSRPHVIEVNFTKIEYSNNTILVSGNGEANPYHGSGELRNLLNALVGVSINFTRWEAVNQTNTSKFMFEGFIPLYRSSTYPFLQSVAMPYPVDWLLVGNKNSMLRMFTFNLTYYIPIHDKPWIIEGWLELEASIATDYFVLSPALKTVMNKTPILLPNGNVYITISPKISIYDLSRIKFLETKSPTETLDLAEEFLYANGFPENGTIKVEGINTQPEITTTTSQSSNTPSITGESSTTTSGASGLAGRIVVTTVALFLIVVMGVIAYILLKR